MTQTHLPFLILESGDNIQMSEVTQSILFRQKLYENFKQSGLLSKLKTSLRTNLLEKLQKPHPSLEKQQLQDRHKPLYLRDKFLACIVREYFVKSGKEYALSILLPESNLQEEDCLNFNELAQIVNLNQGETQGISFLETLVHEWTKFRATQIRERSTQTDFSEPVSKKLEDIEKQYRAKIDYWTLIPNASKKQNVSSQKLDSLAKEEKMKEQFEIEKKRIKQELELVIKAEMEKKYRDKFDFRSKEVQKNHEGRLTELKNREKQILMGLERKKKDLQEKAKKINEDELKMINKYEMKIKEVEAEHKQKMKELENKEKQFWKKELELRAKKRQYEDTIKLVKQKVIEETLSDIR